ncbi:peptidase M28 (plasmid) [Nitrosococcus halophilus Nc 4]|uniref:Peptidase M28 n=1 Tax=Nitrosococcus halophilus (strain Nc4) TaxID=472759 RepID=D5C5H6_NITHN|nr:M20/M25/M40 family metallo-hydrolase [Nitrosococcus halophilus]ADE17030.1 peptidase M28 [Nitrosococcus halophilus Nc 4]
MSPGKGLVVVAVILALAGLLGGIYRVVFHMPGQSYRGLPPPLASEEKALRDRLRKHVRVLSHQIGERHYGEPHNKLNAAVYIEQTFRNTGYEPVRHAVQTRERLFDNIEVTLRGDRLQDESLVIGAHYDTVRGSPGADDNASGVAVLLELARLLHDTKPERTLRLVAFANEEAPFFGTQAMGSLNYARQARADGENIVGMISLEMLGYYTGERDSQHYPSLLGYLYPDTGNFVAFVGNTASRQLVRDAIEAFREHATVPSEGLAAPERLEAIRRSDHWAFWEMGYPALMLTDTANFRNPHYHGPSDTYPTLDYETMMRLTAALAQAVADMARQ